MNIETYRSISTNDSLVLANLGTLLVHIIMQQNKSSFIYFMCVYVLLVSKCVPRATLVPGEVRRGH